MIARVQPTTSAADLGAYRKLCSAVDWLDKMSLPQPSTEGNFDGPAWFQAGFQSAVEGFYLGGLGGSVGALSASLTGVFVGEKTGHNALGVLAGAATAGTVLGALAHAGGPAAMTTAAIGGSLLGAFVTYRGHSLSRVRDACGNSAMLAGPFIHGPAKVACGIAAATALRISDKPHVQMLVGAGLGAALGGALGAVGFGPLGPLWGAVVSGAAAGIGTRFGPRFSQFFRNTTLHFGDAVDNGAQKVGLTDTPMSRRTRNMIGTLPSSFIKEGVRGAILADLNPLAFVLGGISETIQQMDIFWHEKDSEGDQPITPVSTASNPAAAKP